MNRGKTIFIRLLHLCAAVFAMFQSGHAIAGDWPMWGRTANRNMVSLEKDGPTDWDAKAGRNIKWVAGLGSVSRGTAVVSAGVVLVGTNNEANKDPGTVGDVGVLMAIDESSGKFLWQFAREKLFDTRANDWPGDGLCSSVYAEPESHRVWYCTNRDEILCTEISPSNKDLKYIWGVDMPTELGVFPFRKVTCSPIAYQGKLYLITGNGVDQHHRAVVAPDAPSVVCFDKSTGKVIWKDNSPGKNILGGQWSSPCIAEVGGHALLIAALGDAWLYAYDVTSGKVVWRFDCNDKAAIAPQTRLGLPATPVVIGDRLYIAMGQNESQVRHGRLWCIDITKSGDISAELDDPNPPADALPRFGGRKGIPNPNSGVIWQAREFSSNENRKIEEAERVHTSMSTVAVSDGLVFLPDLAGYLHCFDAKTGAHQWTSDLGAGVAGSPLVVDAKVYVGDDAGVVHVLKCSREMNVLATHDMGAPIYSSPVFANGVLYIMTKDKLYAIAK